MNILCTRYNEMCLGRGMKIYAHFVRRVVELLVGGLARILNGDTFKSSIILYITHLKGYIK